MTETLSNVKLSLMISNRASLTAYKNWWKMLSQVIKMAWWKKWKLSSNNLIVFIIQFKALIIGVYADRLSFLFMSFEQSLFRLLILFIKIQDLINEKEKHCTLKWRIKSRLKKKRRKHSIKRCLKETNLENCTNKR